jgi:hypothetical protein
MKRKNAMLAGALAAVMLASPVLAADHQACLQNNRIFAWQATDNHTLIVTDRDNNKFQIHTTRACLGLDNGAAHLIFRPATNLGCISQGDRIGVQAPGFGRTSCSILDVQAQGVGTAPSHGPAY